MALPPMISAKALGAMPQFVLEVAGEKRLAQALSTSDLPFDFIDNRSGYIPAHALATFVQEAARSSGQQNIGLLWSPVLTVADYGAWGQYVLSAPTLGNALRRASGVMPFHSSTDRAWLEASGVRLRYCYAFGLPTHRAYPDIAFSAIGVFLSIFRTYLRKDWRPQAVLLNFPKVPNFVEAEDTFECAVIWNASRLGVEFDSACLLAEKNAVHHGVLPTTIHDIARERPGGAPQTLIGQVSEVARQHLNHGEVSIDTTARSLGIGVRTLQRKLEGEGLRYRRIVKDVRACRAKELLSVGSVTISTIASTLGYETANNFSRAFKQATGVSPTEYRRKLNSEF